MEGMHTAVGGLVVLAPVIGPPVRLLEAVRQPVLEVPGRHRIGRETDHAQHGGREQLRQSHDDAYVCLQIFAYD